jgi:predicted DNA binding CopG/RHH family protein
VSRATKDALRWAAQRQQLTESALVKRLIEVMLQTTRATDIAAAAPHIRPARRARVNVRLASEDWVLLRERASARSLAPATYVSTLVRAHLQGLSPLPSEELRALKGSVTELNAVGRSLNQMVHLDHLATGLTGPQRDGLRVLLKICEGLRDHVRDLIRANVVSWRAGHADAVK